MAEGRRRKKEIRFRVDEEEYKKIMQNVELSKMDISRYMRNSALRKEILVIDFSSLFKLSEQISRVGSNINQIARRVNQGGMLYKKEVNKMVAFIENLDEILKDIYNFLSKSLSR